MFARWLKARRARASVRSAFGAYLSPQLIERLELDPKEDQLGTRRGEISFALFQVRDEPPERVRQRLETAFAIVSDHGGHIDQILSSFILVSFSGFPWQVSLPDRRVAAVGSLIDALGTDIRVIHGCSDALIGNIGSETRYSYGALIPDLAQHLEVLLRLGFGQAAEITATP